MLEAHKKGVVAHRVNQDVAGRLEEAARLLHDQRADPFRVGTYLRAAATLRSMGEPVDDVFRRLRRGRAREGVSHVYDTVGAKAIPMIAATTSDNAHPRTQTPTARPVLV